MFILGRHPHSLSKSSSCLCVYARSLSHTSITHYENKFSLLIAKYVLPNSLYTIYISPFVASNLLFRMTTRLSDAIIRNGVRLWVTWRARNLPKRQKKLHQYPGRRRNKLKPCNRKSSHFSRWCVNPARAQSARETTRVRTHHARHQVNIYLSKRSTCMQGKHLVWAGRSHLRHQPQYEALEFNWNVSVVWDM